MTFTKGRVVLAGIGLSVVVVRLGAAALGAYEFEKNRAAASFASLRNNQWLVQSSRRMRLEPRTEQRQHSAPSATLNAKSQAAAAAELAYLVASAIDQDTLASLTITPDRDSTTLATLRRSALKIRFETSTDGLVSFLSEMLNETTVVRIDEIRTIAQASRDGLTAARLSVEAKVSAWFREQAP